jgi:sirohydrochlorin ferrochelatase
MNDILTSLGLAPDKVAVILVDHGSRREESNTLLLDVVEAYRKQSSWTIVEPAHMEIVEPSIATAFARCVAQGAEFVIVFPYFLAPGRHWHEDIPHLTAEAAKSHPGVRHLVTAPLGLHPLVLQIINERISASLVHTLLSAVPNGLCRDSTDGTPATQN